MSWERGLDGAESRCSQGGKRQKDQPRRGRRPCPEGGEGQVGPVLRPGRLRMRDFLRTDSLIEAGSEDDFAKRCGEGVSSVAGC